MNTPFRTHDYTPIENDAPRHCYRPEVGDMIRSDRFPGKHVGIYVGPHGFSGGDVLHNDKASGAVVICNLEDFSGGFPVRLDRRGPADFMGRLAVAHHALCLIGTNANLSAFHCGHPALAEKKGTPFKAFA